MTRFITYTTRHYDKLIQAVLEHFEIVGLTLVISIALAFMIAMLVMEHKRITAWITRVSSMIYSKPCTVCTAASGDGAWHADSSAGAGDL